MGSLYLAVRMSAGELGCTYAAMVLFDDEQEITEDKLKTLMSAAKIEFESYWPSLFAKMLSNNDVGKLLTKPASGGGGAAAAPAAAAAEEEEEEEEDIAPVGGGLFGDDGDDY